MSAGHVVPHSTSWLELNWIPAPEAIAPVARAASTRPALPRIAADRECPHCGKPIDPGRERYCNHCGEAFAIVDGVAAMPRARPDPALEPAELRTRHVGSLVVGALFLLLVYGFSLGPEASGPAERSVQAMTVGPVKLVVWALAAGLGWYGMGGIASYLTRSRRAGGLMATIAVIAWFVASCAIPVAI